MFKNKYVIAITYAFCGVICALPAIFNDLWFLSWLAYIPVLINEYTRKPDNKKAYRYAWLRGLCFFFPFGVTTFHWIVALYPMEFIGLSTSVAFLIVLLGVVGIPLLQSTFTSFNVVFLCFLKRNRVGQWTYPIAAASMWILQEWAQTLTWAGIPWGKLAVGQVGMLPNIQSTSLLGPYLISFIIIACSGYIAMFLINFKNKDYRKRAMTMLCSAILLFTSNFTYGTIRMGLNSQYTGSFVSAAIQGNVSANDKWNSDSNAVVNSHKDLVLSATKNGADLVVLAETAFPLSASSSTIKNFIGDISQETDAEIILGCFTNRGNDNYNSTVLFSDGDSAPDATYHKQKLVPFGEFIPMRNVITTVLPFVAKINQFETELTAGTHSNIMTTRNGKIGSLICFDSIYETIALESVRNGAEILAISTNDSWFGDSAAAKQHNAMAVLRAIELDRYVIRSGNTGISSIITNKGVVTKQLDTSIEGYIIDEVKTSNSMTLYSKVGNIIILFASIFMVILSTNLRLRTLRIERREERVKNIERSQQQKYSNTNKTKRK